MDNASIADDADGKVVVRAGIAGRGRRFAIEGRGNGPLDAFVNGLKAATGQDVEVLDYHEHAVGGGAQARAAAYLEVRVGGRPSVFGVGIDANIVHASMKAVLSGVTRSDPTIAPAVEPATAEETAVEA